MDWTQAIESAVEYIEAHITEELTIEKVAASANISPFYFQKGFTMLCGCGVGEYIRRRRLSLAGSELLTGKDKVIDLAVKYGYDSADSFTKAFARFHGIPPAQARQNGGPVRAFDPLHIRISLEGGFAMEYRIEKQEAFWLMGVSRRFDGETAQKEIPKYWDEVFAPGKECPVRGDYGVCVSAGESGGKFRYMIADALDEERAAEKELETIQIPAHTWAVFPCRGALPNALQSVNREIFSRWLPASRYMIADGYDIERYADPRRYPKGTRDESYYSEIWIPVREKR